MKTNKEIPRSIYSLVSGLIVLSVWKLLTVYFPPLVVPTISSVINSLLVIFTGTQLYQMIMVTIVRLIIGLTIGVAAGFVVGVFMGHFKFFKGIAMPIIGLFQTIPPVSWVVLALVWFGFNGKPAIFIVVTSVMPIIAINVYEGIINIDSRLLQMAKLYRFSEWKRLHHIVLPSVASYFNSGFRVALGSSWKIAVMGEVFTTSDGIGGMIKLARLNVEPENIIAWSIVVVMLFYVSRLFNWKDINKGGMIVLVVKEVTKSFDDLPVLNNIGFQIADNEIVALIGPSGCGKSTLLNIISGLEPLDIGKIEYSGDAISYVFQDDRLLQWRSVWDNIRIVNNTINENEISELICDVGLKGFEKYKPNQLSGGMKKRCGIARAFYYKSKLLIMDEPFQGLDYCLRQEMLKMLLRVWNRRKQSVLFITHEIDEALTVAGRIVVMSKRPGTIVQEFNLKGIEDRSLSSLEINNIRQQIVSSLT